MGQLGKHTPRKHEDMNLILQNLVPKKPSEFFYLSTREAEIEGSLEFSQIDALQVQVDLSQEIRWTATDEETEHSPLASTRTFAHTQTHTISRLTV